MPDLDIVQRQLRKHWRAPCRLIQGGHPPEVVAAELTKSLASTLRAEGGISGFERLYEASSRALSDQSSIRTLAEVSRTIEQEFGQQQSVKLAARAARRQIIELQYGRLLPSRLAFASQCLRNLLEHHFFAKVTNLLVGEGKRFSDVRDARQYEASVRSYIEPQLMELARRLMSDPTASKLRAPKSSMRRRTTAELLDSPLT